MNTEMNQVNASTSIRIRMTEAEVGAVKDLILLLESASLASQVKKLESRILSFILSIYSMRGGMRLTGYKIKQIEKTYICADRDIFYYFTIEKEDK